MEPELKALEDLMKGIEKAMQESRSKQEIMNNKNEALYQETRPLMVEEGKREIDSLQAEKKEYDEMTINSLVRAKQEILSIRKESEKKYEDMLIKTLETQKKLEENKKRLESYIQQLPPEKAQEKLEQMNTVYTQKLDEVNINMKEFQSKHFEQRNKLDEYERNISSYALELNAMDQISQAEVSMNSTVEQEKPVEEAPTEETPAEEAPAEETPTEETPTEETPVEETPAEETPVEETPAEEMTDDDIMAYFSSLLEEEKEKEDNPEGEPRPAQPTQPQPRPAQPTQPQPRQPQPRQPQPRSTEPTASEPRVNLEMIKIEIGRTGAKTTVMRKDRRTIEDPEYGEETLLSDDKYKFKDVERIENGDRWVVTEMQKAASLKGKDVDGKESGRTLLTAEEVAEQLGLYEQLLKEQDKDKIEQIKSKLKLSIEYDIKALRKSGLTREERKELIKNARKARELGIGKIRRGEKEVGKLTEFGWKVKDVTASVGTTLVSGIRNIGDKLRHSTKNLFQKRKQEAIAEVSTREDYEEAEPGTVEHDEPPIERGGDDEIVVDKFGNSLVKTPEEKAADAEVSPATTTEETKDSDGIEPDEH